MIRTNQSCLSHATDAQLHPAMGALIRDRAELTITRPEQSNRTTVELHSRDRASSQIAAAQERMPIPQPTNQERIGIGPTAVACFGCAVRFYIHHDIATSRDTVFPNFSLKAMMPSRLSESPS